MAIREFISEILQLSVHHGAAGIALQEYALGLLELEVADLQALDDDEEASYFSAIFHGEQVSRHRCVGTFFREPGAELSLLDFWQARLTHLQVHLEDSARADRQARLAMVDAERRFDLDAAYERLLHLWGAGWLHDLEMAARQLWNIKRAEIAEVPLDQIYDEMNETYGSAALGYQTVVQGAAAATRGRGIRSPIYERYAGAWYGQTDMRVVRSRDNLAAAGPFLDVLHNEVLIYHATRYLLQEAYLLKGADVSSLERFIEENEQRCFDCEQTLRLGHRSPPFQRLVRAINASDWEGASDQLHRNRDQLRLFAPYGIEVLAADLINERRAEGARLEQAFVRSLGPGQRVAIEFGWRTDGMEDPEAGRQALQEISKPY